ncbi:MAG TPA: CsgG/HfaB family protein [Leptospiraceae bacterium]|nr:CsgG/HfaB family protein [Leptospiraceae bacterium]HNB98693.1 CsgG/HfaB family protein [Leptospiraceae bacterium]HNE07235.1 CsgG/HfaB family protein [Leptospiraceae bacterium]HNE51940.1 CsgG/HfaB family protein [Leptospiraceae bacterium]HNH01204.1 CsgG/HfaB family protein [Leptospiraceae bacterium]
MLLFLHLTPIILLVIHLYGCASLGVDPHKIIVRDLSEPEEYKKKTIAILPFDGSVKGFDSISFAEKLTHEFVNSGQYQIIERSKINRVLKEQSLSSQGITEADSIKIGKLLAAEGVVVGSIVKENSNTTILARIVDTETGKIWSSSIVILQAEKQTPAQSNYTTGDNAFKPIPESEKPKAEIKDLQLIRSGNFGRFLGLLKNTGNIPLTGNKLYINLKDKKNTFLDTVQCFTDKPVYPQEEVSFSCILSNFPNEYASHDAFFEAADKLYGNQTSFKIMSEIFREDKSGLEGYSLSGILKNDTSSYITYPKVILLLFDQNKKFVGSAIGFGNQKKLASGETTSFKVSAYNYTLSGKPTSYKVQTHALVVNQ